MSALPPKADIAEQHRDVRFVPKADISDIRLRHSRWVTKCRRSSLKPSRLPRRCIGLAFSPLLQTIPRRPKKLTPVRFPPGRAGEAGGKTKPGVFVNYKHNWDGRGCRLDAEGEVPFP